MKRKLDNSSNYPCNKCDEAFQSKWKLKNHLKRIHSLFHCNNCGKEFTSMQDMYRHKYEEHNKEYYCQFCNTFYILYHKLKK